MSSKLTKAIFPVAGLGTHFFPATNSIPKEIMTLVDRPLIQYAIDEARAAGITEFIFETSRGKGALEDYFDHAPVLERELRKREKQELLDVLNHINMDSGEIAYVRQHQPLGLGHAVWCARRLISDEPFAMILPDDVIAAEKPCLKQMVGVFEDKGGNIIAAMEVAHDQTSRYSILDVVPSNGPMNAVRAMVKKPAIGTAPSNLAVIGRYIVTPNIFRNLSRTHIGSVNEVQLTDAASDEIAVSDNVYSFRFDGQHFDCGTKNGFLQATVAFALERSDFRDDLYSYLQKVITTRTAAE